MGGVFGKSKKQVSRVTEQDKSVLVSFANIYCFPVSSYQQHLSNTATKATT